MRRDIEAIRKGLKDTPPKEVETTEGDLLKLSEEIVEHVMVKHYDAKETVKRLRELGFDVGEATMLPYVRRIIREGRGEDASGSKPALRRKSSGAASKQPAKRSKGGSSIKGSHPPASAANGTRADGVSTQAPLTAAQPAERTKTPLQRPIE